MRSRYTLQSLQLSSLETVLAECEHESARYPANAERLFAFFDAVVNLNWHATGSEAYATHLARLNRLLARYEWRAVLSPSADEVTIPYYQPKSASEATAGDRWEQRIISGALFDMRNAKTTSHLTRCEVCQAFIVSKTVKRKQFCGPKCKQQAFESKPENREKKRATMRQNYQTKKTAEARAKAAAFQGRSVTNRRAAR